MRYNSSVVGVSVFSTVTSRTAKPKARGNVYIFL